MRRAVPALLLLAACASPDNPSAVQSVDITTTTTSSTLPPTTSVAPTTTAPDDTDDTDDTVAAPEADGTLTAKEVLAAVAPSIVFLETSWASGTGFVIDGGYVVTNAHVVTPFDRVTVTAPDGEGTEIARVVGVDFAADLALLGPLDADLADLPSVGMGELAEVETGDEVYLIGYPSETESAPTPTISAGIVSRTRNLPQFDQTYIQTDADIAGGQSGGALVSGRGRVIGVSGSSLDEAFALALSIDDVTSRLDSLVAGGDPWRPLPDDGKLRGRATVPGATTALPIELVPAYRNDQVSITLEADPAVLPTIGLIVYRDDGTPLVSANAIEWAAALVGVDRETYEAEVAEGSVLDPDETWTYRFDVEREWSARIELVHLDSDEPVEIGWTSNRELVALPDEDDGRAISMGATERGVIEPLENQDVWTVDLVEGQPVLITVESAAGDVAFSVLGPGERWGLDTFYVDDSDLGIGGLDASDTFTATVTGPHRIIVTDYWGQSGYRLSVERG